MMPSQLPQTDRIGQQAATGFLSLSSGMRRSNNNNNTEITEDDEISMRKACFNNLPQMPDRCGPPTISLGLLLDFAIQNTVHELTVLSELLPKKKENDRKISVVQFAHSTRMVFVKLLAIVKWLKISKKFEPLASIRFFLDQQSQIFIETADRLVKIIREELRFARLPVFQVSQAVDVLTLGSYPRLPQFIKERFILKPPLTSYQQALTLRRLNHVLEFYISRASDIISPKIDSVKIKNGMLVLKVSGEFEMWLTLLKETDPPKWCLLNIKFLIDCYQVAFGQDLVHPLQVNFIHQIIQEKLEKSDQPLNCAYLVLHTFAQSLQLDALFCQVHQLNTISQNYIRVEDYNLTKGVLVISYWQSQAKTSTKNTRKGNTIQYRITIFCDKDNPNSGLKTKHYPIAAQLPLLEDIDSLSLSRLIGQTILFRCRERLLRIQKQLDSLRPFVPTRKFGNSILALAYPLIIIGSSSSHEQLQITINSYFGSVLCQVESLGKINETTQLSKQFTEGANIQTIKATIDRLRILIMVERFNKAIHGLQVKPVVEFPVFMNIAKQKNLSAERRIFQFNREEHYYLVVTFVVNASVGVELEFYIFSSQDGKFLMNKLDAMDILNSISIPGIELDCLKNFLTTNSTEIKENYKEQQSKELKENWIGQYQQLQATVAAIDDRLLFYRISEELDKKNIKYLPLCTEPIVGGNVLRITDISEAINIKCEEFFDNLISCYLRLDLRQNLSWPFECTMRNCPLFPDDDVANHSTDRAITLVQNINSFALNSSVSEAITLNIIDRLTVYALLYIPVKEFSIVYKQFFQKHCNIKAFNYYKLVISYGSKRDHLMILSARPKTPKNKAMYVLNFGQCASNHTDLTTNKSLNNDKTLQELKQWNPHVVMASILTERFNRKADLVALIKYLLNTDKALGPIYNFAKTRLRSQKVLTQILEINSNFPVELQSHLTVINETTIRITYANIHLEFRLLANNFVRISESIRSLMQSNFPAPNSPYSMEAFWQKYAGNNRPQDDSTTTPTILSSGIFIDGNTLQSAMSSSNVGLMSPFETYLYAISFLQRLNIAMDAVKRGKCNSFQLPIKDIHYMPGLLSIIIPTISHNKETTSAPGIIKFHIFICPMEFKLIGKLEFLGMNGPNESDLQIFEKYFDTHVLLLHNEMAVFTFITICRLSFPGIFAAFAKLMFLQMNPEKSHRYKVTIQLTTCNNDKKMYCGVVVDDTIKSFLFMLQLRPNRLINNTNTMNSNNRIDGKAERKHLPTKTLTLVHNIVGNDLTLRTGTDQNREIVELLKMESQSSTGCCIWPCIRNLVENLAIEREQ